jgi:hypothetical protein
MIQCYDKVYYMSIFRMPKPSSRLYIFITLCQIEFEYGPVRSTNIFSTCFDSLVKLSGSAEPFLLTNLLVVALLPDPAFREQRFIECHIR